MSHLDQSLVDFFLKNISGITENKAEQLMLETQHFVSRFLSVSHTKRSTTRDRWLAACVASQVVLRHRLSSHFFQEALLKKFALVSSTQKNNLSETVEQIVNCLATASDPVDLSLDPEALLFAVGLDPAAATLLKKAFSFFKPSPDMPVSSDATVLYVVTLLTLTGRSGRVNINRIASQINVVPKIINAHIKLFKHVKLPQDLCESFKIESKNIKSTISCRQSILKSQETIDDSMSKDPTPTNLFQQILELHHSHELGFSKFIRT